MRRVSLVNYRFLRVTPDTCAALRLFDERLTDLGGATKFLQFPQLERDRAHLSLLPAGREVRLRVIPGPKSEHEWTEDECLAIAWSFLIPLGFTPWNRYPHAGPEDDLYHFFGPWAPLYDRMLADGKGQLAWSSVCAAAQTDSGTWESTRPTERFVQAQLHRIGLNCGPVDGIIGDKTRSCIEALGFKGESLPELAESLSKRTHVLPKPEKRRTGHVIIPGFPLSVSSFGGVHATRTNQGAVLTIEGAGRIVVDVGNYDGNVSGRSLQDR